MSRAALSTRRIVGWAALALVAVLAWASYRVVWGKPFTINMLANRQALEFLVRNPELFTAVGLADGTIFDHHSDKLAPCDLKKRDDDYAQFATFLHEVREFDRASLGRQDQITYDILVDQYETGLAFQRFGWLSSEGLYPISPMFGIEVQLPSFMESTHVISNDKTARNYVARLTVMGVKLDGATTQMQWQATQGVVLPAALLERSLTVIHDTVAAAPERNELVTSFVTRMDKVKALDAVRKQALAQQAVAAVTSQVYPAYARMSAALEALKPAAAPQTAGVGRLPDGAAFYAESLKQMTTTDYSPDKVHQLGLSEVARITAEMDALLKAQGLTGGSVGERMSALGKDPRFLLPTSDEGRRRMLARYQQILDEVSARMPQYFRSVPKTHLTVERVPAGQEKGTSGGYYQPAAMDGSRPGMFFANLRDLAEMPTWGMKTLAYHEGIPGPSLPDLHRSGAEEPAAHPPADAVYGIRRRLGALCRAFRSRDRHVQGRPLRGSRAAAARAAARRASGRRYRPARQGLVARAGDRLHGRHDRHGAGRCHLRGRALHGGARAGLRLQDRRAQDPRAARES